jgi:hypothetical protein
LRAGQDAAPARGIRNPAPGRHWRKCQAGKCRNGAPEGERIDRKMRERLRTVFRRADRKVRQRALRKRPALFGTPFPHCEGRKKDGHTLGRQKNKGSGAMPVSVRPRASGDPGPAPLDSRLRGNERRLDQTHGTNIRAAHLAVLKSEIARLKETCMQMKQRHGIGIPSISKIGEPYAERTIACILSSSCNTPPFVSVLTGGM